MKRLTVLLLTCCMVLTMSEVTILTMTTTPLLNRSHQRLKVMSPT